MGKETQILLNDKKNVSTDFRTGDVLNRKAAKTRVKRQVELCIKLKALEFTRHKPSSTFQYGFLSSKIQSWLWSTFAWTYPLASFRPLDSGPAVLNTFQINSWKYHIWGTKSVQIRGKNWSRQAHLHVEVRIMSWNFSFRLCLPFLTQSTPLFHGPKKVALPRSGGCLYHVVCRPRERPHLVLSARALDLFSTFRDGDWQLKNN